uniref:Uncharacterized protein n=1 Tax=Oryza glaberrima TaxID=4538 RepID=I1QLB6_ORYGL
MDKALKSEIEGVEEIESCFIAPSEDTPRQGLWLSPLDIVLANRGHTPNVYFYRRDVVAASTNTDFFEVGRIKEAMAKALVAFYPLAGRLHLPLDAETCVTFPVNIRRRVTPPLPDRYFGNALVIMKVASMVRDVVLGTLAASAAQIKSTLGRLDGEMLQSVIDYNEIAGMSNKPAKGNLPDTELRMIGWLGMPVYDVDFGWGKPEVMSRAESVRSGFVYMMDGTDNDGGGVRVLMCMEARKMEEFERLFYAKFVQ